MPRPLGFSALQLLVLVILVVQTHAFSGPLGSPAPQLLRSRILGSSAARSLRHSPHLPKRSTYVSPRAVMQGADSTSISAAIVASGHYWSVITAFGLLVTERLTLKPNPTAEEATRISRIDAGYGIAGLGILGTGYLRATQYAKGWAFYSHSPFFFAKMLSLGLVTALSLYPTIIWIKGAVAAAEMEDKTEILPVSEELTTRLRKIVQAEIHLILTLPFFATLMSRGIGYNDAIPVELMAGLAIVPSIGACVYSVKTALNSDGLTP